MSEPLLSVCLITYNHAKYIREAIDGVLMQKVTFSWELIIADDFSTDGTREIILEYKEKYPELIKLILQGKNVGTAQNWMDLMAAPSAKYIAYFEGDDYWTYPYKLQEQVDYLENHPECALCFHNVRYEDSTGVFQGHATYASRCSLLTEDTDATFTIQDTLKGGLIPTCSVLLRNEPVIQNLPEFFHKTLTGDWLLWLLVCKDKTMRYFHCPMAVYRVTSSGASFDLHRNMDAVNYSRMQMLIALDRYWGFQLHNLLKPVILHYAEITPIDLWSGRVLASFARYSLRTSCRITLEKSMLNLLYNKLAGVWRRL